MMTVSDGPSSPGTLLEESNLTTRRVVHHRHRRPKYGGEQVEDSPVATSTSSDSESSLAGIVTSQMVTFLEDSSDEMEQHQLDKEKSCRAKVADPVRAPSILLHDELPKRKRSTIRVFEDDESNRSYIDIKGPWKRLPTPNMEAIRAARARRLEPEEEARQPTRRRPRVRFDSVQVRSYGQTLGDNPAVSHGVPIQLDWCYNESPAMNINVYVAGRRDPRPMRQLVLTSYYRHKVLMAWYSIREEDIIRAKKDVKKARKRRQTTALMSDFHLLEDCLFSTARKFARRLAKGNCRTAL
eukprot:scaffold618_cov130-Cylindrotheca_fusiformis.AAC.38